MPDMHTCFYIPSSDMVQIEPFLPWYADFAAIISGLLAEVAVLAVVKQVPRIGNDSITRSDGSCRLVYSLTAALSPSEGPLLWWEPKKFLSNAQPKSEGTEDVSKGADDEQRGGTTGRQSLSSS